MKKLYYAFIKGLVDKNNRVKLFAFAFIFLVANAANATTYYLTAVGQGSPQTLSSWHINANATGAAPVSFANNGDVFNVPIGINGVLGANTMFGSNSVSGTGVAFQIQGSITLTITGTPNTNVTYQKNGVTRATPATINAGGSGTNTTDTITTTTTYTVINVSHTTTTCAQTLSSTITLSVTAASYIWTGLVSTDWNDLNNWYSGVVPTLTSDVVIPLGTPNDPIIYTAINAQAKTVTIGGASLKMQGTGNLTIAATGSFTNNGNFDATGSTTGAVIFAGSGTVNGSTATTFKNVTLNGTVTFPSITVNPPSSLTGNLTLNTNGSLGGASTRTIIYSGVLSTLIYNTGTIITSGNEWNDGTSISGVIGAGIPQNVIVQNGSKVALANAGASTNNRSLAGNLTINAGSSLSLNSAANPNLYIGGDWTNYGLFVHNNKTITFNGAFLQHINGSATFYDLRLQNAVHFGSSQDTIENSFGNSSGGMIDGTSKVVFKNNTSMIGSPSKFFYDLEILNGSGITHNSGGGPIHVAHSFTNNGILSEDAGYKLYFDSSGGTETMSGIGTAIFGNLIIGNNGFSNKTILNCSADFTIIGTGAANNMTFNNSSVYNGNNNSVTFSINPGTVGGTGTANFYNAFANVSLNLGSGISTINHNLRINSGGSIVTNAPVYGSVATLTYNTTNATYNTSIEWTNNTAATGAGAPYNVSVLNTNSVIIQGDRTIPGILDLTTGNLDINGNTLTVNGGFTGADGKVKGSVTSNLIAGGTGTINFDVAANYLKNFTVNSSADLNLGKALNIAAGTFADPGTLIVNAGSILHTTDVVPQGALTIKSDANGDARVGNSSGTITGNVTVERYIPPLRAWRFLSVPFSSSTQTIRDAWQEGVNNYTLDYSQNNNPYPGFGTHITGDNISTEGYDLNTTVNPSMKVWDPTIGTWNSSEPWTINTNIALYPAYCLFVRGSRAVDLSQATSATPYPTVLRINGVLNQTGLTATKGYTGGAGKVIFVGNPYASPINIYDLIHNHASGFDGDKFWVWDPKLSGSNNVGGYVSYTDGVMAPFPPGGNPSYPNAASMLEVESGQAFMVQLSSGSTSASMQFKEADKVTAEVNVFGFAKQTTTEIPAFPVIYTDLMLSAANGFKLADGVGAAFDNKFSAKVDHNDAKKVWNVDENLTLVRTDSTLAIEFRPMPVLTDTLFYRMYLVKYTPYTLKLFTLNAENMPLMRAWLVDKYLNTQKEVNLLDTTLYNFMPNSDLNSYRDRFMLVFKRQFIGTPVTVTKVVNESDPNTSIAATAGNVNIYPNPASADKVMLQFGNMEKGKYKVTVYSTKGQKLSSRKIEYSGGTNVYMLALNPSWAAGVYTINIANKDSIKAVNLKLVISR